MGPTVDIYGGRNPAEIASYSIPEAAHYLQLPPATVRSWALGRRYPTDEGPRFFKPLVHIADVSKRLLSFQNLVELHVLSAIRRKHQVKLREVRRAIDYVGKQLKTDHPLVDQQMLTDGRHLFIDRYGKLINASQDGQMEMRKMLEAYLERIERDDIGLPARLYPFTSTIVDSSPKPIVIDPRIQFGRPCIAGTGVPTSAIVERFKAGDSVKLLAEDYGRNTSEIEAAIRYEIPEAA